MEKMEIIEVDGKKYQRIPDTIIEDIRKNPNNFECLKLHVQGDYDMWEWETFDADRVNLKDITIIADNWNNCPSRGNLFCIRFGHQYYEILRRKQIVNDENYEAIVR
jgi:hypothetical protein